MVVSIHDDNGGPSPGTVAWRRFLLELVLCLVLTAMIVVVVLRARHEVLASPLIAAMVAAILRILWRRDD